MSSNRAQVHQPLEGERLLDLKEFAGRLGVSERTAFNLWLRGALPTVYVGRLRRVRATDVAEYIANLPTA